MYAKESENVLDSRIERSFKLLSNKPSPMRPKSKAENRGNVFDVNQTTPLTHFLYVTFNSLDAQREACEAYIKSQAHEGWRPVPDRYDDGGLSGASLSLLTRMAFDQTGERLTPTYSVKKGTRYRYYVSTSLITGAAKNQSNGQRIYAPPRP